MNGGFTKRYKKLMKTILTILLSITLHVCFSQEIKKIKITDLEKTIKESKTPLIVNFWATYCVPCIEEIPYFQEQVKKNSSKGLTMLLVSLDLREAYPKQISMIATRLKFTAPIV